MSKASLLQPKQIIRVLRSCKAMQHGQAKACAIALSHAALRVTEIALLDVKTVLLPSGAIREEVHLPSRICKNYKARTIWLSNPTARKVIQDWVDYRLFKQWGTTSDSSKYQGLNPSSKFVLNNRGRGYSLQPKTRRLDAGKLKTYWCCDALEQAIRLVYRRCGLSQCSSHSGRKSLVTNSVISGVSLEQMARILGHSDSCTTIHYVVIQQTRIREMNELDWL